MSNQLEEIHSDTIVSMVRKGKRRLKRPEVGDLFTLEMDGVGFIHGVVARNEFEFAKGQVEFNFVYIFRDITHSQNEKINLHKDNLLFPPLIVNDMNWRCGYFQTYSQVPISELDVFDNYCFYSDLRIRHENEFFQPIDKFEPCIVRALSSSLTVAIMVYMHLHPKVKVLY